MKYFFSALIMLASTLCFSEVKNGSKPSTPAGVSIKINQKDIQIITQANAILSDEAKWNRHDNRVCPKGAKTFSLYCALFKASEDVLGEFDHRRGALEEIRRSVEHVSKNKKYEHRLMDYNNDSSTNFADIKKVLSLSESRLQNRLKAQD